MKSEKKAINYYSSFYEVSKELTVQSNINNKNNTIAYILPLLFSFQSGLDKNYIYNNLQNNYSRINYIALIESEGKLIDIETIWDYYYLQKMKLFSKLTHQLLDLKIYQHIKWNMCQLLAELPQLFFLD